MYHDENRFNVSASFPYVGSPTDYPYGPTYAPLMRSAPTIGPATGYDGMFQQAQSWDTAPAPSTVIQSPGPNVTYREIRPKPMPKSTRTSRSESEEDAKHKQHGELEPRRHSKYRGQLGQEQDQRATKKARRTGSEVTDTVKPPVRDDELRLAWLYFRACFPRCG